jgi:hypothetical protein
VRPLTTPQWRDFEVPLSREKQEWQYDALVAILLHHGELDQSPRDILMNSACNAFGERAANFRISSETVTAHQVFEQLIFDGLNVQPGKQNPYACDRTQH